jgi:hypothetical protein
MKRVQARTPDAEIYLSYSLSESQKIPLPSARALSASTVSLLVLHILWASSLFESNVCLTGSGVHLTIKRGIQTSKLCLGFGFAVKELFCSHYTHSHRFCRSDSHGCSFKMIIDNDDRIARVGLASEIDGPLKSEDFLINI